MVESPNIPDSNIVSLKVSASLPAEGQTVVVIGNPLRFESTVSTGIVSAIRDIPGLGKFIQITAPVSPGSSGSPVLNIKGEVVGVVTLIATEGQNLNFAVPSDRILALKETAKTLLLKEYNAATTGPNDVRPLFEKGLIELWQENWSAALTYFQKAIEKNPQDAYVWVYLGIAYSNLGRYQDAVDACKQAIRIEPDLVLAHYTLGIAYSILGRYQDAVESYKQAIRIKPDLALAHYTLGVAYDELGRKDLALEQYKLLKTLDAELANKLFNWIYK